MKYSTIFISTFFILYFSSYIEGCTNYPNGTETKLHWFEMTDYRFKIYNFQLSPLNGTYKYPINLSNGYKIELSLNNTGSETSDFNLDTYIFQWVGNNNCNWFQIPTYHIINTKNLCNGSTTCPVKEGNSKISFNLDLTNYPSITNLLKTDASYQFVFALYSNVNFQSSTVALQIRGGKQ
ncbi:MD-2-related lipid-recognition domain-containing protein [Strongyloides ratti]|uniref:MD-2-related lipid-recognition domain-containing protein n=1 Tax=Strongyloides ratti TaxID=34506 RepID=A0A090L0J5_STRRB|nr:MD-2-related lipid-recognition domain-containing protein [Strongyloides ratti]CEF61019.1 MD-2-related lipid-recognition domain-containing protein [Strongyloides ratti]